MCHLFRDVFLIEQIPNKINILLRLYQKKDSIVAAILFIVKSLLGVLNSAVYDIFYYNG